MTQQAEEDHVRRVCDQQEIVTLANRFANACDDRDFDAVAEMLAPDVQLRSAAGVTEGRDDVIAQMRSRLAAFEMSVHAVSNHVIEVGDDLASGVVVFRLDMVVEGTATTLLGRYHDQYVRIHGVWHIAVRASQITWSSGG